MNGRRRRLTERRRGLTRVGRWHHAGRCIARAPGGLLRAPPRPYPCGLLAPQLDVPEPELAPVSTRPHPGGSLKQAPEEGGVLISYPQANLFDSKIGPLEHPLRFGDPEVLNVRDGRVTCRLAEAPPERARAQAGSRSARAFQT